MSARATALLTAQLRAYGGKSVQNAGDGHNVYDSTGTLIQSSIRSEYPEGEAGTEAQHLDHLELLRQVLLVERQTQPRYTVVDADDLPDIPKGWVYIRDTELDRNVAICHRSDADVIIAGLLDNDITTED
jgi:hypothetical protein